MPVTAVEMECGGGAACPTTSTPTFRVPGASAAPVVGRFGGQITLGDETRHQTTTCDDVENHVGQFRDVPGGSGRLVTPGAVGEVECSGVAVAENGGGVGQCHCWQCSIDGVAEEQGVELLGD